MDASYETRQTASEIDLNIDTHSCIMRKYKRCQIG